MEKVTGIGGLFFRAQNPAGLARWYYEHLGITVIPAKYEDLPWQQQAGPTAFAPSPFRPTTSATPAVCGCCFRVNNLDANVAQLRAAGVEVTIDPETYPNGRFARLYDPEGDPIELWQPLG